MPAQVSLISMFTIGVPAFLLAQVPNRRPIRGHFVENILRIAVPGGITDAFIMALTLVFGALLKVPNNDISTAATIQIAVVGFVIIYRISKPLNPYKWLILIGCIMGLSCSYIFIPAFFALTHMSLIGAALCVTISILSVPIVKYVSMLTDWIWDIVKKNYHAKVKN